MTREVRADGITDTDYVYETTTSRLKTVTDPKGQVTTYTYASDNRVLQMAFTNEAISTPDVSFTYDTNYPRMATMVDGTGTTTYTYEAPATAGAGQVATVDGPLTNDAITMTYDDLGRMTARLINGYGISSLGYDGLGRLTQEINELGTFTYGYAGVTNRLTSVTYPNGQTSTYSYFGNSGDRRLQTIHHQTSGSATLSKFDYTYSADGNILTWRQQGGTDAVMWEYGYDAAEQLTRAVKKNTNPTPSILKRYAYAYDAAGNRTVEQIDNAVVGASHNNLNRLTSQHPSGAIRVSGTVNELATVSIQGQPASVSSAGVFDGTAVIPSGTTTFTVSATDTNNNVTSKTYELSNSGSTRAFTYDANGNMTSDGTRTFEWDARNQLLAVEVGSQRTEYTYDGLQRRIRIHHRDNGSTVRDSFMIWAGLVMLEERLNTGEINRFFLEGEHRNSVAFYLTRDHLNSVREMSDSQQNVVTRNEYDPYGRQTKVSGSVDSQFGFTGHFVTSFDNSLTLYRGYDPAIGRWFNEDPARDGTNLYAYVESNPINDLDPLGLFGIGSIWTTVKKWAWPYRIYKYGKCTLERQACADAAWDKCKALYPSEAAKDVYSCTYCFSKEVAECDGRYIQCLNPLD